MTEHTPPKKLARSRDDRYVGGVAAGLAQHFSLDPIFVRIGFLASLALGGLGLLTYVILLVVMPVEGDPSDPLPPIEPKRRNLMIGAAALLGVIGLLIAASGEFAAWIFGFWPGTLFGILLWTAAVGVAIWLLASGKLRFDSTPQPGASNPATRSASPSSAVSSTGNPTYASSPSQLSTELMETRQLDRSAESGSQRPETEESGSAVTSRQTGTGATATSVQPVRDDGPSTIGKIMLWFAIGLTGLTAFCILFVISAGTTALFGGIPMAAVVIALGAGMVFAGLRGRRQVSFWLLTAAVAVTIPMAAVSIADLRVEGNYGEIDEAPLVSTDIPEDGYKMAAGNMTVDLRRFAFDRKSELNLRVSSGMGLTSVIVPDDVCVAGSVNGKVGAVSIRGRQSNGFSIHQTAAGPVNWKPGMAARGRMLNLNGDFKLGAFEVVDNTQWRQDGRAGSFEENDLEPDDRSASAARERATAACAVPSRMKPGKARGKARVRAKVHP